MWRNILGEGVFGRSGRKAAAGRNAGCGGGTSEGLLEDQGGEEEGLLQVAGDQGRVEQLGGGGGRW